MSKVQLILMYKDWATNSEKQLTCISKITLFNGHNSKNICQNQFQAFYTV